MLEVVLVDDDGSIWFRCARCGHRKGPSMFHVDTTRRSGRQPYCKPCRVAYNAERRDAARDCEYRRKYGITLIEYDQMLRDQNGRCVICERSMSESRNGRLYVDHCHETGAVRALLCHMCNLALGYFYNDPNMLRRAASLLEASHAR